MKHDRIEEGRFSNHGKGLGTVTREMIGRRAAEIAVINGRDERQVLDSDWAEARRELLGEERLVPPETREEQQPESARWEPAAGSEGKLVPNTPAPDEQTFAEKLVEEGVADAEHDQSLEAIRQNLRRERKDNP
jgi:hypothetical protein